MTCPICGSDKRWKWGKRKNGVERFKCVECGKTYSSTLQEKQEESTSIREDGDTREVTLKTYTEISSLEQLIEYCKIDLKVWRVDHWICNVWPAYIKNADKEIETRPLFQVKAWLVRKVEEIRTRNLFEQLVEGAVQFAPVYPKVKYPKHKDGMCLEVELPDIHFGRLTWAEESGEDYDIKIASKMVETSLARLLEPSQHYPIDNVLLPLGNDFFNVNNKENTTVHGTLQQEDTRWQKTFQRGTELAVKMIDMCQTVAPVNVVMVPGNHDEEKSFYLGECLKYWYRNVPTVSIDNSPISRKYFAFGNVLLGFTHGSDLKIEKLMAIMPYEVPELWARSAHREWHIGHTHHKKDFGLFAEDGIGIMIRSLRSLVPGDAWTHKAGFVGSPRSCESFLWSKSNGLVAQFTVTLK